MKRIKFDGTIKRAHNRPLADLKVLPGFEPLPASVPYETEFDSFGPDKNETLYTKADWESALQEMKEAGVVLDTEDIVNAGNAKAKAKQRAKQIAIELDKLGVIKPTIENDDLEKLKTVYNVYKQMGKSEQEARDAASTAIGLSWPD